MMSLFSSFDFFLWKLGFICMIVFMPMISYKFWLSNSNISTISSLKNLLETFFFSLNPKMMTKSFIFLNFSLMIFIFLFNFSSIYPYNFSYTSQISVVLMFALSIWLMAIIYSIFKNMKGFISHCIPEGSPFYLVVALFMIEIISNFIRPITLTVRLVANILAGHLLMSLLSSLVVKFGSMFFLLVILTLVEIFVSMIQSYIFSTMIVLYYSETF